MLHLGPQQASPPAAEMSRPDVDEVDVVFVQRQVERERNVFLNGELLCLRQPSARFAKVLEHIVRKVVRLLRFAGGGTVSGVSRAQRPEGCLGFQVCRRGNPGRSSLGRRYWGGWRRGLFSPFGLPGGGRRCSRSRAPPAWRASRARRRLRWGCPAWD